MTMDEIELKDEDPFIFVDGEKCYSGKFLYYGKARVTFVGRVPNYFGHKTSAMFVEGHVKTLSTHMANLSLDPPK